MCNFIYNFNVFKNNTFILNNPIVEGYSRFKLAFFRPFDTQTPTLTNRFRHLIGIAVLWTPFVVMIVYIVRKVFFKQHKEFKSLSFFEKIENNLEELKLPSSSEPKLNIPLKPMIKRWFKFEHLYNYFLVLEDRFKEDFMAQDIDFLVEPQYLESFLCAAIKKDPSKKSLAYPFFINGNHWTLLFIDRRLRTFEYYDSLGGLPPAQLNEIMERLSRIDPGESYIFHNQITTKLQHDGFQCGPWICHFLYERLNSPNTDFKKKTSNPNEDHKMIAAYRTRILNAISERKERVGEVVVSSFQERRE